MIVAAGPPGRGFGRLDRRLDPSRQVEIVTEVTGSALELREGLPGSPSRFR